MTLTTPFDGRNNNDSREVIRIIRMGRLQCNGIRKIPKRALDEFIKKLVYSI